MRKVLLFVFFILSANLCFGSVISIKKHEKPKSTKPAVLVTDTSAVVNSRHLDSAALKAYSKQPEFQYNERSADLSWWARFWRWVWDWFTHLFSFNSKKELTVLGVIFRIIEWLLIAAGLAALVIVILKSIGINVLGIFQKKPISAPIPYSEYAEDINTIDFDAEIENAVSKHNYRFAVRLLYLKCLKQLSDAGLIDWQIDKTNTAYINELANNEQRTAFKIITRQFEYVWYGEFLIDGAVYKNIDVTFRDFNKRVA